MCALRYKMVLSYDGTDYCGFQKQTSNNTIANEVEKALKIFTKQDIKIHPASRTDRGVHALGQVVHFDTDIKKINDHWVKGLNKILPLGIKIISITLKDFDFHARFDVKEKEYHYHISFSDVSVFHNRYCLDTPVLDVESIKEALPFLIGEHDFGVFSKLKPLQNSLREITSIRIIEKNCGICFIIRGRGFLRYMIRGIVGNLILVGLNQKKPEFIKQLITTQNKKLSAKPALANGLVLYKIDY